MAQTQQSSSARKTVFEDADARPLHHRVMQHQTWLRSDGALQIESSLLDVKGYDAKIGLDRQLSSGEPVHDMRIHAIIDQDLRIREIQVEMRHTPFDGCTGIIQAFEQLRGESVGVGWNAVLKQRFRGAGGCRHLLDMLRAMATVVFQSTHEGKEWTREDLQIVENTCHSFRSEGEVMQQLHQRLNAQAGSDDHG